MAKNRFKMKFESNPLDKAISVVIVIQI